AHPAVLSRPRERAFHNLPPRQKRPGTLRRQRRLRDEGRRCAGAERDRHPDRAGTRSVLAAAPEPM
ncbi:MAG: hypothetical protein AVDCRST_MAG02-1242, partial [uncultured Rubrobacteraceae bacterium]